MRNYHKLRAFELADEMALQIYKSTKVFPKSEQYGLTSQIRRAAVSVASNIVEGSSRHTEADYIRFLDVAYASACELNYQLGLSVKLSYLAEPDASILRSQSDETCKVLNGLIRSLRSKASSLRPGA